jgi:hypothetical protein
VAAPIGLDVAGYVAFLGGRYDGSKVVQVNVHLAAEPGPETRALLAAAIAGAMSAPVATLYDGATLIVRSPPIQTRFEGGRGPAVKTNAGLHAWMRRLIERALVPIARAHRIERVTVGP